MLTSIDIWGFQHYIKTFISSHFVDECFKLKFFHTALFKEHFNVSNENCVVIFQCWLLFTLSFCFLTTGNNARCFFFFQISKLHIGLCALLHSATLLSSPSWRRSFPILSFRLIINISRGQHIPAVILKMHAGISRVTSLASQRASLHTQTTLNMHLGHSEGAN